MNFLYTVDHDQHVTCQCPTAKGQSTPEVVDRSALSMVVLKYNHVYDKLKAIHMDTFNGDVFFSPLCYFIYFYL